MLDLAMECKHVDVFVYVSTAYSHCYRKNIEEKFYDSPGDLKIVNDMIASDEATENGLTEDALKMILGDIPNVYVFTKAISEELVREFGNKVNFAIGVYRPSVVTAATKEPLPGWVGNNNGPALIFLGGCLGLIHISYHLNYPIDFVPVDYSINALIALIYDLSENWKSNRQAVIYNYGSSTLNSITLKELYESVLQEAPSVGSVRTLWHPFHIFCDAKWKFWIGHFFLHFCPAILADIALLCMKKRPRALQLFCFGTKHLDKIDYFGNSNWKIHPRRTMELYDRLSEADQSIFYFDIRKLDWPVTVITYMRGGRIHILKEPFDNLEQSQRHFYRMRRIHYASVTVVTLLGIYFAIRLLFYLFNLVF